MLCRILALGLIISTAESFNPSIPQLLGSRASQLRSVQHAGALGLRAQSSGNSQKSLIDLTTSVVASLARPGAGAFVSGYRAEIDPSYKNPTRDLPVKEFSENLPAFKPVQSLELYEFEACPFCRKVREALSMLDLDATVYPCPKDGSLYRPKVEEMGGKSQFPYLVDPNTQFKGYESDDIIRYLFQTYGDGVVPLELSLGPITTASAAVASSLRRGKGSKADPERSAPPAEVLELWSYEASPFCRIVRERLCELELPYKVVTVARGSSKRAQLQELGGKMQVPFLVDANTGKQMYESEEIVNYLDETYGPRAPKSSSEPPVAASGDSAPETVDGPGWDEPEASVAVVEPVAVEVEIVDEPVDEEPQMEDAEDKDAKDKDEKSQSN